MTDAVSFDSKETSGDWEPYDNAISSAQKKAPNLGIQFLDFVFPRNVVTGSREFHFIPFAVENFVGASLYPAYKLQSGGRVPQGYEYYEEVVQRVGKRLAEQSPRKGLNFEFTVVNDWSINAWCLPGGKIALNLGILRAMEDEQSDFGVGFLSFEDKVAAVLSHEITHATARHFGRSMEFKIFMGALIKATNYAISYFVRKHYDQKIETARLSESSKEIKTIKADKRSTLKNISKIFDSVAQFVVSGLGKCSSRSHELEADKYGMMLLHKSGMDTKSAIWLQHFFIQQQPRPSGGFFEWLKNLASTHPSSQERLAANLRTWEELKA